MIFVFGCLAACLVVFLILACVYCIGMEKDIVDLTDLVERRVTKLYNGEL